MSSSIREIARQTGLSTATVSLALRGKGRMSAATRKKICDAAQEAGYQSHPLLSQAFCLVRQPSAQRYRETLAFVAEWDTETGPEHQKNFECRVMWENLELARGSGRSKKQAEVEAATAALEGGKWMMLEIPKAAASSPRRKSAKKIPFSKP